METFSALLTLCVGNSSVTGEFPFTKASDAGFDSFFDLRLNNLDDGDVRRHRTHHDVNVMKSVFIKTVPVRVT